MISRSRSPSKESNSLKHPSTVVESSNAWHGVGGLDGGRRFRVAAYASALCLALFLARARAPPLSLSLSLSLPHSLSLPRLLLPPPACGHLDDDGRKAALEFVDRAPERVEVVVEFLVWGEG